jgi:hypothetical protein
MTASTADRNSSRSAVGLGGDKFVLACLMNSDFWIGEIAGFEGLRVPYPDGLPFSLRAPVDLPGFFAREAMPMHYPHHKVPNAIDFGRCDKFSATFRRCPT